MAATFARGGLFRAARVPLSETFVNCR